MSDFKAAAQRRGLVNDRYEIRDYAAKASKRKFHVWDRFSQCEVLHTDNHERALKLIVAVGVADLTQHFKDYGHHFEESDKRGVCKRCKPRRRGWGA